MYTVILLLHYDASLYMQINHKIRTQY